MRIPRLPLLPTTGPTSKPQVPILETDYDHVDLLLLTWADDMEDIKDRSDSAVADPNRPPHPPTPAITAAVAMVLQAAVVGLGVQGGNGHRMHP